MRMPVLIYNQINDITAKLIKMGLAVQQNFPTIQNGKIAYSGIQDLSIALKDIAYEHIYNTLDTAKNYNIKMVDGSLIQMMYCFDRDEVTSHRLAFFPSPSLESFQNEPELYEDDELYADVLAKSIVTFPLRFDFDSDNEKFVEIHHPKSHMTVGQYKNCRIPVSEPLTPDVFISFLLQSFYNTAYRRYSDDFIIGGFRFPHTITSSEKNILHFGRY